MAYIELISREEAMQAVRNLKEIMLTNGEVINALYHLPTIEIRPKGKWEEYISPRGNMWICPICAEVQADITNFCPNCGAEMKGEE